MTERVNFSRRNLFTARDERLTIADESQTYRLDLSNRCLTYANVVCETCRDNCAFNAISFAPMLGGAARPQINAARCTGCGDCVEPCPADALTLEHLAGKERAK